MDKKARLSREWKLFNLFQVHRWRRGRIERPTAYFGRRSLADLGQPRERREAEAWCTRTSKYRRTICTRRRPPRAQNVWTMSNRRWNIESIPFDTRGRVNEGLEFSGERSAGFAEIYGARGALSLSFSLCVFRFYRRSRVSSSGWLITFLFWKEFVIGNDVKRKKKKKLMYIYIYISRVKIFIEIRCVFFESVFFKYDVYWKVKKKVLRLLRMDACTTRELICLGV